MVRAAGLLPRSQSQDFLAVGTQGRVCAKKEAQEARWAGEETKKGILLGFLLSSDEGMGRRM